MQTAKRVLLVEDDIDDQQFFFEALTLIHPSIACDIANDGVEALALVDAPPPFDIIFLDLNMPKMDGFECLRRLKQNPRHQTIPVVILSTSSRAEDRERTKQLGADMFLTKPSSYNGLFDKLRGFLSNPRIHSE